MLADAKLPVTFWAEAVNTACYVQNRVLVNKSQNKTPYELFNGRTPAIGFLKPFDYHVMILNTLDNLEKFEVKGDEESSTQVPEGSGNPNPTGSAFNPPEPSSKARLVSKRVAIQEETPSLDNILSLTN
nr:ribonuclease H-like domain-containing protein [Tanacetum cinerariifolium]GFB60273.1 ribonuclease H-like domain-containing protein [Tanacetum cinerariifolium]